MDARVEDVGSEAVELAQLLIRVDTSNPPGNETAAATVLRDWLAARGIDSVLVGPDPARQNLVATVPGRGEGPSIALCGHLDVVPAGEVEAWRHPPFGGELYDGMLWGRGAVDMKAQVATRAAALVGLVRSGVTPAGTVRLIAQADEEVNSAGVGMSWLVRERPDLRTDWALEEGGGRHLTLPDGRDAVLFGVADKALMPVELHVRGPGGHACSPAAVPNPALTLARMLASIEAAPVERELVPAATRMLQALLGDAAAAVHGDDIDSLVAAARRDVPALASTLDAITRTTYTPTMLCGSAAVNVVPDHATATIDCRLLPDHSGDAAVEWIAEAVEGAARDGEQWEVRERAAVGGSSSEPDDAFTRACQEALTRVDGSTPVMVPTMNAFYTDAGHLRREWNTVTYGLWPWKFTTPADYHAGVHAPNERIDVRDVAYAAQWHLELLLGLAGAHE